MAKEWWKQDYEKGSAMWQAQQQRVVDAARAQEQLARDATNKKQREAKLKEYQGYQKGQYDDLTRGFRQFSEAQTGRALGNTLRAAEQGASRRNIAFSGLAGGAATEAQAQLQGQALGMQQKFASQLGSLQAQNQDAFLRGEFAFANEMQMMYMRRDFEQDLTMLQAQLQKDAESRNSFWDVAGAIGGYAAGGPIGAAVGSQVGSWVGGN